MKRIITSLITKYIIPALVPTVMGALRNSTNQQIQAAIGHFIKENEDQVSEHIKRFNERAELALDNVEARTGQAFRNLVSEALEQYLGTDDAETAITTAFENMRIESSIARHLDAANLRDVIEETDFFIDGIADKVVERLMDRMKPKARN